MQMLFQIVSIMADISKLLLKSPIMWLFSYVYSHIWSNSSVVFIASYWLYCIHVVNCCFNSFMPLILDYFRCLQMELLQLFAEFGAVYVRIKNSLNVERS